MRRLTNPLFAAGAVALIAAALVAGPTAMGQEGTGKQVELRYQTGTEALKAFTPAKALTGGKPFRILNGPSGMLDVAGTPVKFAVAWHKGLNAYLAGMDTDGDGKLEENEYVKLSNTLSGTFKVRAGDKSHLVRVADLRISIKQSDNGGIVGVYGGYLVAGFYQGVYEGKLIRLFDDDLDGAIKQDGSDSIMIGRTGAAIPLMKVHQVGNLHCSLEAAADGSSVTVTPLTNVALGIVETSFRRGLKVLAIVDKEGKSYDLVTSGRSGIPAGSYKLSYGVLSDGSAFTVIKPTDKCPTYEVQAGKINKLLIGAPLWVSFSASIRQGNVSVSPRVNIYGAANEEYCFDFSGGTGRPHVLLLEGGSLLQPPIPMEYG